MVVNFHHLGNAASSLLAGIEDDLGMTSSLCMFNKEAETAAEETEAEGLKRGVAALLEASLATGEGEVERRGGCNSISLGGPGLVHAAGAVSGISIN